MSVFRSLMTRRAAWSEIELSVTCEDVPAGGGSVSPVVTYRQTRGSRTVTDGATVTMAWTGQGTASSSWSDGSVSADSLRDEARDRTALGVVDVTVEMNGKSAHGAVTVFQEANIETVVRSDIEMRVYDHDGNDMGVGYSGKDLPAEGGTYTLEVIEIYQETYTSGYISTGHYGSDILDECSVILTDGQYEEKSYDWARISGATLVVDSAGTEEMKRGDVRLYLKATTSDGEFTDTGYLDRAANTVTSEEDVSRTFEIDESSESRKTAAGGYLGIRVTSCKTVRRTYTSGDGEEEEVSVDVTKLSSSVDWIAASSIMHVGGNIWDAVVSVENRETEIGDVREGAVTVGSVDGDEAAWTIRQGANVIEGAEFVENAGGDVLYPEDSPLEYEEHIITIYVGLDLTYSSGEVFPLTSMLQDYGLDFDAYPVSEVLSEAISLTLPDNATNYGFTAYSEDDVVLSDNGYFGSYDIELASNSGTKRRDDVMLTWVSADAIVDNYPWLPSWLGSFTCKSRTVSAWHSGAKDVASLAFKKSSASLSVASPASSSNVSLSVTTATLDGTKRVVSPSSVVASASVTCSESWVTAKLVALNAMIVRMTVTVERNLLAASRTGTVTVTYTQDGLTATYVLTVTQTAE